MKRRPTMPRPLVPEQFDKAILGFGTLYSLEMSD
jgi:hypothetical protein